MKATFEHSIDVLVKAYLNNTLEHGNCCACAVGNLVADGLAKSFIPNEDRKTTNCKIRWSTDDLPWPRDGWPSVFLTFDGEKKQRHRETSYFHNKNAKEQIDSTGYPWQDLAKIEFAFETADRGSNDDDWMFNGLMAVVDVLAEIHGIDLEKKEEAKSMFKKVSC